MTSRRGTSNTNARGNSADRARRRLYLINQYGDGETAPCDFCGEPLTVDSVTVHRVVPGIEGGTYRRSNIRPACMTCNSRDGQALSVERNRARAAERVATVDNPCL